MDSQPEPTRIPFFLPLIVGVTETEERVVIINPIAQTMMVLGSMLNGAEGKAGQPPAAKSAVEAMPRVEIREEGDVQGLGECVICLEEYKVGTTVKKMPCQHGFHEGCIEKWLGLHGSCPVCRYVMPVEEGDDVDKKGGGDDVEERESGGGGERGRVSLEFFIRVGFGGRRRTGDDDDDDDDDDDGGDDQDDE